MCIVHRSCRLIGLLMLGWLVTLATQQHASADIIFQLNTVISGDTPKGSPPWLKVTFANNGTDKVKMTVDNFVQDPSQFVSSLFFNVNISDKSKLAVNYVSGQKYDKVDFGKKGFGGNTYDILIDYETANNINRFTDGEQSVFEITAPGSGLTENSFSFSGQYMVAHVQGIPLQGGGTGSSWIGPDGSGGGNGNGNGGGTGTPIPEPTTLALFGLMAGAGAVGYRLRRHKGTSS
jgi:hypothetical protein